MATRPAACVRHCPPPVIVLIECDGRLRRPSAMQVFNMTRVGFYTLLSLALFAFHQPLSAQRQEGRPSSRVTVSQAQPSQTDSVTDREIGPFDPAEYIRIYEESGDKRILLYDSTRTGTLSSVLRADADSKIVIELDESRLTSDMALNGLFMAAELSRLDTSTSTAKVEVLNYSEIAQDPRTQASQAGVALRTAGEVRTILQNLYDLTRELIAAAYQDECTNDPQGTVPPSRPKGCTYANKMGPNGQRLTDAQRDDELRRHLRASQPRIEAMATFFSDARNALVLSVIGNRVFDLDLRSLQGMAAKLRQDVATFVAGGATPEDRAVATATADIHLNLQRLWDDMQPLRVATRRDPNYFDKEWKGQVFLRFKQVLAPGSIDLRRYKAADGETLTLTVQARAAGGEGSGGITRDFQIAIKKLRTRVSTEPSAFYLRRLGEVRNDKGEIIAANFAAAPGVTFGPIFYSRGLTRDNDLGIWRPSSSGLDRFWSVLAPGVGVNVSFMNFATGDFDPSIKDSTGKIVGGFRSTTSSSIQVGTGLTGSLFANAVQFAYGWNLNVSEKRSYWGIGFGFLQIGQEIAKYVKK